jgi:hypothetical protein
MKVEPNEKGEPQALLAVGQANGVSKGAEFAIYPLGTTDLTKKEKEMVKEQFKDIVKSMPSLAIFLLPGGAFLLPLVLKVIPDLVPSAFRDNEVEKMK